MSINIPGGAPIRDSGCAGLWRTSPPARPWWHVGAMDGMSSPLLRPYSLNPLDRIADGVVTVLLQSGVHGMSMGAIGRAQRTSAQAFHQYVSWFRHETETSATATLHRIAGDPLPAEILDDARTQEVELCRLRPTLPAGRPPGTSDVVALVALADGLRAELVRPRPALSLDDVQAVLDRQRSAVLDDAARPAA